MVTIYAGNPAGAGNGTPNLDFTGLPPLNTPPNTSTFFYYTTFMPANGAPYSGLGFGVEARAGGGNPAGDWRPFYRDTNYSASIIGQLNVAKTGLYTFSTTSDDGSVLKIDNKPVVNNNFFQGPTTRTGQVLLDAGIHPFQVQFFQGGGGKSLDLGSGTSINKLPEGITIVDHSNVPQLVTTVYAGQKFIQTGPNAGQIDPNSTATVLGTIISPSVNFDYGSGSRWSPFGRTDDYSDSITGKLVVDPVHGTTFGINSDDGSFLFIDGKLVIDNQGFFGSNQTPPFGLPQKTGIDDLTPDVLHDFEVRHYQGGGGTGVTLFLPNGVRYATPNDLAPPPPPPPPPPTQGGEIPEPATLALLALGMAGCFAASNWRRRRKVA
jgi:hypothetical protein